MILKSLNPDIKNNYSDSNETIIHANNVEKCLQFVKNYKIILNQNKIINLTNVNIPIYFIKFLALRESLNYYRSNNSKK